MHSGEDIAIQASIDGQQNARNRGAKEEVGVLVCSLATLIATVVSLAGALIVAGVRDGRTKQDPDDMQGDAGEIAPLGTRTLEDAAHPPRTITSWDT